MRRVGLSIIVILIAVLSCLAGFASTNAVPGVVSFASTTNTPATKLPRRQCEAITKSGSRCKRNAVSGEKLCRQHLKIANRTANCKEH